MNDGKDKRKFFEEGDKVKVVYLNSEHHGKIGVVKDVTKERVYVQVGNHETRWSYVSSLEKIAVWSVS